MTTCPKCKADVTGRKFCTSCGTPIPQEAPKQEPKVEAKVEAKPPMQRPQTKPAPKPVAKSEEYVEPKASVPSVMVNRFKTATLLFAGIVMLVAAFLIDKGWTKLADLLD